MDGSLGVPQLANLPAINSPSSAVTQAHLADSKFAAAIDHSSSGNHEYNTLPADFATPRRDFIPNSGRAKGIAGSNQHQGKLRSNNAAPLKKANNQRVNAYGSAFQQGLKIEVASLIEKELNSAAPEFDLEEYEKKTKEEARNKQQVISKASLNRLSQPKVKKHVKSGLFGQEQNAPPGFSTRRQIHANSKGKSLLDSLWPADDPDAHSGKPATHFGKKLGAGEWGVGGKSRARAVEETSIVKHLLESAPKSDLTDEEKLECFAAAEHTEQVSMLAAMGVPPSVMLARPAVQFQNELAVIQARPQLARGSARSPLTSRAKVQSSAAHSSAFADSSKSDADDEGQFTGHNTAVTTARNGASEEWSAKSVASMISNEYYRSGMVAFEVKMREILHQHDHDHSHTKQKGPDPFRTAVACHLLNTLLPDDGSGAINALKDEVFSSIFMNHVSSDMEVEQGSQNEDSSGFQRFSGKTWFEEARGTQAYADGLQIEFKRLSDLRSQIEDTEAKRKDEMMKKTVARFVKRGLVQCFAGWKHMRERNARKRKIATKIVTNWYQNKLPVFFEKWLTFVDMTRHLRARMEARTLREDLKWNKLRIAELEQAQMSVNAKTSHLTKQITDLQIENTNLMEELHANQKIQERNTSDYSNVLKRSAVSFLTMFGHRTIKQLRDSVVELASADSYQDPFLLWHKDGVRAIASMSGTGGFFLKKAGKWGVEVQARLRTPPEEIIVQWVNFHMKLSQERAQVTNPAVTCIRDLQADCRDCSALLQVLISVVPGADFVDFWKIMSISNMMARAEAFLDILHEVLRPIEISKIITAVDIVSGSGRVLILLAYLMMKFPGMMAQMNHLRPFLSQLDIAAESLESLQQRVDTLTVEELNLMTSRFYSATTKTKELIELVSGAHQAWEVIRAEVQSIVVDSLVVNTTQKESAPTVANLVARALERRQDRDRRFIIHVHRVKDIFDGLPSTMDDSAISRAVHHVNQIINTFQSVLEDHFSQLAFGGGISEPDYRSFLSDIGATSSPSLSEDEIDRIFFIVTYPRGPAAALSKLHSFKKRGSMSKLQSQNSKVLDQEASLFQSKMLDEPRFCECLLRVAMEVYSMKAVDDANMILPAPRLLKLLSDYLIEPLSETKGNSITEDNEGDADVFVQSPKAGSSLNMSSNVMEALDKTGNLSVVSSSRMIKPKRLPSAVFDIHAIQSAPTPTPAQIRSASRRDAGATNSFGMRAQPSSATPAATVGQLRSVSVGPGAQIPATVAKQTSISADSSHPLGPTGHPRRASIGISDGLEKAASEHEAKTPGNGQNGLQRMASLTSMRSLTSMD